VWKEDAIARLGVSVMPLENRHQVFSGLAPAADRLGYEAVGLPESWSYDMTVLLAEAAARTHRVKLASGILSVWGRSPGTLAMAASTLATVSGGRFVLGLGASTAQLVEGLHDVPFGAPVAKLRRTVTQVRALLKGERIPLAVTTAARPLRLNVPPTPEVPIYVAALADASVRVAGEVADGWLPFFYARDRLADGIALMREGAARSGDPDRPLGVWATIPTVVSDDPGKAREGAAWFVSFYLTSMGTLYRQTLVRHGYGAAVEAVMAANSPKFTGAVPAKADELLEQFVVYGTPAEARERMGSWLAAGADLGVVFLRANLAPEEIEYTLDAFTPMLSTAR
jgi:alkanesulfonate monooxygenase SsuD/methylene tetrahydromethanopterin reductase-like flavin-dependent oxidoreductase (luciferase family)